MSTAADFLRALDREERHDVRGAKIKPFLPALADSEEASAAIWDNIPAEIVPDDPRLNYMTVQIDVEDLRRFKEARVRLTAAVADVEGGLRAMSRKHWVPGHCEYNDEITVTAPVPDPLMQEADALEALIERLKDDMIVNNWGTPRSDAKFDPVIGMKDDLYSDFERAVYAVIDRAMPLIRALRERVKELEHDNRVKSALALSAQPSIDNAVDAFCKATDERDKALARIESLEAALEESEANVEAINHLLRTTDWKDVPAKIESLEAENRKLKEQLGQ